MTISLLRLTDFRNFSAVELAPCLHLNVICGNNGSGKTSLIEAVYYLSLGRSFRSATASRLTRHATTKFSIFTQLVREGRQLPIGVERYVNGVSRMRVNEKEASSIAELAAFLPVRLINSQSHQLFESGPGFRRKYLDWGLFYQAESFLLCWRQFERVLKQRNAALRDKRPRREVEGWTEELVKYGLQLDTLRREYILALAPILQEVTQQLLPVLPFDLHYQPGWDETQGYAAVLAANYGEECYLGHTQYGPHRADLDIKVNGNSVKHFLSRGQQKLLICAMIVAQGIMLSKYTNKSLIYLVDDLPSELDSTSKQKLISLLSKQNTQIFITAIESKAICEVFSEDSDISMKVFHVEHGNISEMPS